MPDVYLTIATADADVQERLAEILELRATDPDQRAMLERYTADALAATAVRVADGRFFGHIAYASALARR